MITAPFNFVPLSEKVFFPDWADSVSHDVPFEDAQSGVIDITITAKSPMFIRNHSNDRDNPSSDFCNHNGEYYIPGSSVKGMVRSVLEIMSFSKMSLFDDNTYAVRDLNNKELYMSKMTPKNTFCGWLKKVDNGYAIEDCGIPGRIRLDKINPIFYSKFYQNFDEKKEEDKTAEYKYNLFDNEKLPTKFTHIKNDNGRDIYIVGDDKEGTIIFTGQPSSRKEGTDPSGKIYEFIFFDTKRELEVEESVFENFKFAYFDGRKTQPKESLDWKFWKEKLYNGEKIPVFFQKDDKGEIKHFGLSYLYKLPYKYSIKGAIKSISNEHFDDRLDLAQTIFGFIDSNNQKALKGRVQFSHFKADTKPGKFKLITTVLGSPRASYYPIYIKQEHEEGQSMVKNGKYHTLMEEKSTIAGRKRYPLHQKIPNPKKYDKAEKSATTFQALGTYDEDSKFNEFTFRGKLRYHNLKKSELGAILSALTFHGNSDEYCHSIGMAKSYGFGKISVDINLKAERQIELLQTYETLMSNNIDSSWLKTKQIKELFAMAHKNINIDRYLKYLTLDPTQGVDDFRKKKTDREYLPLVSDLANTQEYQPNSFTDVDVVNEFFEKEEVKQKELQEKEKESLAENELLNNTPERMSSDFKDAIKNYVLKIVDLPYYDYSHLKLVFEGREDDIEADDIYNMYMELTEHRSFVKIEKLLLKREQSKATDLELAELYSLLIK